MPFLEVGVFFIITACYFTASENSALKGMGNHIHLKLCPFLGSLSENEEVTPRAEHCPFCAGTKSPPRAVVSDCKEGAVTGP